MRRVFILGLDSLDYEIIKEHDFPSLKQKEFGKVSLMGLDEIATNNIWGSFMTGNVKNWKSKEDFSGIDTIFDRFNSIVVDFEPYNFSPYHRDLNKKVLRNWEEEGEEFEQYLSRLKMYAKDKKELVFSLLRSDYELFAVLFHITDMIQHLFFDDMEKKIKWYKWANQLAGKLKEKASNYTEDFEVPNPIFLILSDHGQTRGKHNKNAFYSSNVELGLDNPHITDFYEVLRKLWVLEM